MSNQQKRLSPGARSGKLARAFLSVSALLVVFLSAEVLAAPAARAQQAREARLEAILRPLLRPGRRPAREPPFQGRRCEYSLSALTRYVFFGSPFLQRLRFAPECDAQGKFEVRREPFPVELELRHLGKLRKAQGLATLELGSASGLAVVLEGRVRAGKLVYEGDARPIEFTADYRVGYRDLAALGEPANQSGQIHVVGFEGEPIDFKREIKVE